MCRGDRREAIYLDGRDCEMFLATLGDVCDRTGFFIHAYVLMPNHYHLLLETPEANLVAGMKWFQGTYTQRFNARHHMVGHLFQGRYKALVIDRSENKYFRAVSDYIHLNPARARLLVGEPPRLTSYRWSSFREYLSRRETRPPWLNVDRVLAALDLERDDAHGRKLYANYLEQRVAEILSGNESDRNDEWKRIRRGWYLGNGSFRDRLEHLLDGYLKDKRRDSYSGSSLQQHDLKVAENLLACGLERLDLTLEEVWRLKHCDPKKQGLAWLLKGHCVIPDDWILKRLEMGHRSNISRAVSTFRSPRDHRRAQIKQRLHKCTD